MARATKKKPLPENAPDYSGRVAWECVLTAPVLRELRVSTLVGAPVDPDRHILLIETLEEILEVASKKQVTPRYATKSANLAAEEIPGVIAAIDERRAEAVDEAEKAEKSFESRYDDAVKDAANTAAEHATIVADHCKEIDALRREVALAEHNLAEATRMVEALRAEKPLKVRGAKS